MILKADKSNKAPEVDALLDELGNKRHAIPYYGLFRPNQDPIHFDGVYYSSKAFLSRLGANDLNIEKPPQEMLSSDEASTPPERISRLAD